MKLQQHPRKPAQQSLLMVKENSDHYLLWKTFLAGSC